MTERCNRVDCQRPATGAIGIALYPPAAFMRFNGTEKELTRLVMGLVVCDECFATLGVKDVIDDNMLAKMARLVESSSGVAVDLANTTLLKLDFNDKDYLTLLSRR